MKNLGYLFCCIAIAIGMLCLLPGILSAAGTPPALTGGDGGWTHSGTHDEWEWGKPSYRRFSESLHCAPGSLNGCWVTDLDSTYENSCDQELFSINIPIPSNAVTPIYVTWMQEWIAGSNIYDHVQAYYRCNAGSWIRVWYNLDEHPHYWIEVPSGPIETVCQPGDTVQLRYRLDSDDMFVYAGYYIDDVRVFNADGDIYFEDFEVAPNYRYSTKTAPNALDPDGTLEYTLVIDNSGLLSGTAALTDPIPTGAEYITGSASVSPPGAGTLDDSDGIHWSGFLGIDESVTVTYRVRATAYEGTLVNTAVISDAAITQPVTLTHSLDLYADYAESEKVGSEPTPNGTINYTVTIINDGTAPSTASLSDPTPNDTVYIPGSAATVPTGQGTLDATNGIHWTGTVGGAGVVSITYQVRATIVTGHITNTAVISSPAIAEPLTRQHIAYVDRFLLFLPNVIKGYDAGSTAQTHAALGLRCARPTAPQPHRNGAAAGGGAAYRAAR